MNEEIKKVKEFYRHTGMDKEPCPQCKSRLKYSFRYEDGKVFVSFECPKCKRQGEQGSFKVTKKTIGGNDENETKN